MSRWQLAEHQKLLGQLDQVETLFDTCDLTACEVDIPIKIESEDIKFAVQASSGLVGPSTRSYEIWWDGNMAHIILVAEKPDISNFKNAFLNMYPGVNFTDLQNNLKFIINDTEISYPVPEWYAPVKTRYEIFDVGYRHGHLYSSFDQAKAHSLITQIVKNIQMAKHGWLQFVFKSHDFSSLLSHLIERMDRMQRKVESTNYTSTLGAITGSKVGKHPEFNGQFSRAYKFLRSNAVMKMQAPQMQMSVRGLVEGHMELDLSVIETIPVENVRSNFEHLTTNQYSYDSFINLDHSDQKAEKKVRIRTERGQYDRLFIFQKRLLPQTQKWNIKALNEYCDTDILGRYYHRKSPPYLILNNSEMGLFCHLPDPRTPNVRIGRITVMPTPSVDIDVLTLGTAEP